MTLEGSPGGSVVNSCQCRNWGDVSLISGLGRSPEKEMATLSSILTWKIPQTEEPGGLQSMGQKKSDTIWQLSTYALTLEEPVSQSVSSIARSYPTLRPHGLQHARLPCSSPTPGMSLGVSVSMNFPPILILAIIWFLISLVVELGSHIPQLERRLHNNKEPSCLN